MKAKSIDEAKSLAKVQSLETENKGKTIYIIYCNRTKYFYIDTDGLIRMWEQLIGYYINGALLLRSNPHNGNLDHRSK